MPASGSRITLPVIIVVMALLLRLGAVWFLNDNLTDDRDAYLAIAGGLLEGDGYVTPGSQRPTAFRPPLYPTVLAGIMVMGGGIGVAQALLGATTVWLTYLIGRRVFATRTGACLSAGMVALDPLLIMYTTFPMTETLFTFLVAALLLCLPQQPTDTPDQASENEGVLRPTLRSHLHPILCGVLFGLCALCRPTIWAFGGLLGVWWVRTVVLNGGLSNLPRRLPWGAISATILIVAPWAIRNQISLGWPIITTTHGGYTLLLGNNPVFYSEVVRQPWGTVWDGESLDAWQQSLKVQITAEPSIVSELDRDRWMQQRALQNIGGDVPTFLRACWLRLRRLWNLVPQGEAADQVPSFVRFGVGAYYGLCFVGLGWAIVRLDWSGLNRWAAVLLLMLSFSLVHAIYWSNVRMRAPLVPAIALLSTAGWMRLTRLEAAREGP